MTAQEFKEQYFPFKLKLYRLALRLLGQNEDAEDAVQETYVRLWRQRGSLNEVVNAEAYCITIVKNISLDLLRQRKRHGFTIALEDITLEGAAPIDLDVQSDLTYVLHWVRQLPLVQKQIFEYRHRQELSIKEIAERMSLTENNIKVILSRLRKQLKEDFLRYEQR